MTDEELKELVASLALDHKALRESQKETDRQLSEKFAETDRQMKETNLEIKELRTAQVETDRQIKALSKNIGGLNNKFGSFTEGMALPSMSKVLTKRFHMNVIAPRVRVHKEGEDFEADVMAYANTDVNEVCLVEVKSHLKEEGIDQLLENMQRFHHFFPEHQDMKVYGILAGVDVSKDVKKKATQEGVYIALIHDDLFDLKVPAHFHPRAISAPAA
ncbi:DUF3782 domain-containing protein [Deltaproteobacteria bacterium TL4]